MIPNVQYLQTLALAIDANLHVTHRAEQLNVNVIAHLTRRVFRAIGDSFLGLHFRACVFRERRYARA